MAQKKNIEFLKSLVLLDHSVALVLQLGDRAGANQGRVAVLRDSLERAQSDLDAHRKLQPYEKRLVRRKADRVFALVVEYLTALIAKFAERA